MPTIAVDPSGSGVVLAGSNVGGVYRSTNFGASWIAANTGISVGGLSVASLAYSPVTAGKVYAALGNHGPGGVEVSTDNGQTWALRSTVPAFNGDNPYTTVLPSGKLVAQAPNGFLYAATTNNGVMRSADDGATWTAIGLPTSAGAAVRGIVVDPNAPDTLYVANYGIGNANFPSGLYVSTNASSSSPTFSPVPDAPADVEDLTVIESTVYVAADADGVWSTPDGGATWRVLIAPNFARWSSVEGYRSGPLPPVLYAGAAKPRPATLGGYDSVMKSIDGGLTWTSVTAKGSVHNTTAGPNGRPWWLAALHPEMMLGQPSYIPRQLVVNPANPNMVVVTGKTDVWSTTDAGSNWYPMVRGLSTTVERGVAADPNRPGTSYAIGYDWGLVGSADGMQTVKGVAPDGVSAAFDIALDTATSPSAVYVAGFSQSNPTTTSDVFVNPDPLGGASWTSLGLSQVTGGASIYGLEVRQIPPGAGAAPEPVVLAAVGGSTCSTQCGIWRKAGASAWTRVSAVAMTKPQGGFHASFAWPNASGLVYLFDPASGLWRSTDAGATWTEIWIRPSNNDMTGYLAANPSSPGVVYVSLGTLGVYKLTDADTGVRVGNGIIPAIVGSFTGAGPVTVGPDGAVWVAQVAPFGTGLFRSGDGGSSWTGVDDGLYRNMASFPTDLTITSTGQVMLSTRGDGVVTSN